MNDDPAVIAAIDIGSNSIKLRVGKLCRSGVEVLLDTTEVVKLGQGLINGMLRDETMQNASRVVTGMVEHARSMGAEPRLVGTQALRRAANAGEFLRIIRDSCGAEVDIISGEEEARLSWRGAVSDLGVGQGRVVMFDTGGGSTEFVSGSDGEILSITSVPIGAVSLTERFFGDGVQPPSAVEAALSYTSSMLSGHGIGSCEPGASAVGLGGGVVAMASVRNAAESFIPTACHGAVLTLRDVRTQIGLYASLTLDERRRVIGLPPSRADVILASACIVQCTLETLGLQSFTVSINGLRHGVITEESERAARSAERFAN